VLRKIHGPKKDKVTCQLADFHSTADKFLMNLESDIHTVVPEPSFNEFEIAVEKLKCYKSSPGINLISSN
jgi:hypothetical protein